MKLRKLVISFALLAVSAFAADIDGKWAGSVETPGGAFPVSFEFKADGAKLIGTTTGPDGMETKLTDGKVDGNKISFSQAFDFGGMPITITYSGVLTGTDLKLTADFGGMPLVFALKKA